VGLGAFFFIGIIVAVLSQSVQRAQRRAWLTEQSLREADRRKDEFLAVLAHELRNPLAPIGNGLQILEMADDDPALRHEARVMMQRQFEHLVRLVDDLLDVSRIARGKIELRREHVPLDAVANRAVEAAQPLIEALGHRLQVKIPPEPLWLRADPVRLAQVVTNLLTNAARYTDRGGEIVLEIRRDGDKGVVSVRDTGIGIATEELPLVFDMFMQGNQGIGRGHGGLGLGLTLVKSLVRMHGGEVAAHSEGLGKGSEFRVRLPLIATPSVDGQPRCADVQPQQPRRILVVDDNFDSADSLAQLLKLKQHEICVAHSGAEAVHALGRFQPEIAILDLGMPGMDGCQLARQLRGLPGGEAIKLVALTGWGSSDDRERTQAAGFDHHLVKPITSEDLNAVTV
jgi:CheY-like chemotaxis protein